ncbi:MAG: nuclear transport factor 2 family protein [Calditrichia bacterium]
MHSNAELIQKFYASFQQRDYRGMIECYHPDVQFKDEAFQLEGKSAGAMWHMLCERGKDLKLEYSGIEANDESGRAHWDAWYTFSQTGRKVHNSIDATFTFRDGKIIKHTDVFNFWRWSRQALGPAGMLLGWTPFLRNKVADGAQKSLNQFMTKYPEYQE